jgi:hypothetical protein
VGSFGSKLPPQGAAEGSLFLELNSLVLKVLPSVKIDTIFFKKIPYMYHRKMNSKTMWQILKNGMRMPTGILFSKMPLQDFTL